MQGGLYEFLAARKRDEDNDLPMEEVGWWWSDRTNYKRHFGEGLILFLPNSKSNTNYILRN